MIVLFFILTIMGIKIIDEEIESLLIILKQLGCSTNQNTNCTLQSFNSLYDCSIRYEMPLACDENGHIIGLQLQSSNLRGVLPSDLAKLSRLQTLVLNSNALSGTIPAELSSLMNLKTFYIQQNRLSGAVPRFNAPFDDGGW